MERKCEMKQFLPLCVAVSLHIFIPFRILISFFTSCFVRYICFALCLVDKTHKIDLKKKISGVYSCPLSHRHEFLCDIALSRFQHALHSQRIISFRLSSSGVFLLEIGASSIREEISSIQNSKPIKKLRHFEWLHCLFSIEFSWQKTLSNSIQFLQMIKWEWKKVIPNYAIKIAFLQFNPKYLPQHR